MEIVEFFEDIKNKILSWFEELGEDVIDFLKPLALEIKNNGGKLLMETALAAVIAAEAAGGSGSDKFSAAKEKIIAELQAKGLPIVLNAIHGAIETAVAKMKAEA